MSFPSLCVFTYTYPVSFLSKCHRKNHKEVLAVRTSYRKEVLALLSCNRKEVLAVSRTQAQAIHNQPQEELLLVEAKISSCACIIFGLYCILFDALVTLSSFTVSLGMECVKAFLWLLCTSGFFCWPELVLFVLWLYRGVRCFNCETLLALVYTRVQLLSKDV